MWFRGGNNQSAGPNKKRFQVTRVISSFAGRHARLEHGSAEIWLALPSLPAAVFGRRSSPLRKEPYYSNAETGASKRPFAPLERLPASEPPLQDRSFWPASSAPRRIVFRPVRLWAPLLALARRLTARGPLPKPFPGAPGGASDLAPLWGLRPAGSTLDLICRREVCLDETRGCIRSPPGIFFKSPGGSSFPLP